MATSMAASVSYLQTGDPELLDVIDDEWLSDTLPDDGEELGASAKSASKEKAPVPSTDWGRVLSDIQLPPGTAPPNDEQEGEIVDARTSEPERWLELGLHTVH